MSTPREIRRARRAKYDPWAVTVKGDLDPLGADLPLIEWTPSLPVGDATELPYEEGMQQFRMAQALQEFDK